MLQDGQCAPRGSSDERRRRELGAAAVGAEQVPFHGEQARARAGEAGFDRGALRHLEIVRQLLGLEMRKVGRHAGQHEVGELAAEAVAVGAAIDLGGERRGALARALGQLGRRDVEPGRALALGEGHGFEDALLHHAARLARQPGAEQAADQGQRLVLQRVADLAAALAVGLEIEHRPEAAERALGEHAGLAEMPALDPLVGLLLPFQGEARRLALAAPQHRAVGLRRLLQHIGRQAHRLVEAVGVGQHRPQLVRRQVEGPCPGGAGHERNTVAPAARMPRAGSQGGEGTRLTRGLEGACPRNQAVNPQNGLYSSPRMSAPREKRFRSRPLPCRRSAASRSPSKQSLLIRPS